MSLGAKLTSLLEVVRKGAKGLLLLYVLDIGGAVFVVVIVESGTSGGEESGRGENCTASAVRGQMYHELSCNITQIVANTYVKKN